MNPCPLCTSPVHANPRYPEAVCDGCKTQVTDEDGRPLRLSNRGFGGGLIATYEDGTLPILYLFGVDRPAVFIRGARCAAQEHRFGGIVIQALCDASTCWGTRPAHEPYDRGRTPTLRGPAP